ncbi:DNA repair protein XRCC1 isoform X1 [Lucilia cuprina]|uniref:DNA repair protein XRCC1 isoform X1 n=2 Tax=Lucilia cuprina TaxID=7375 RepID=UPI001F0594DD|nr:DNA repair protein XRCC1 isoform X1 [Lucilia cuprina]
MPFTTFTRVREVSSEDNVHLAENLIQIQPGKKWKTKNSGEKSAYVILEMSDCQQITGIDIGNEHSAFVEVLVGKSTCGPQDFKEILITCSFMTPIESKSSNNTNRVRCFSREALVPSVAESKWSLVKIICTQPFNKHVAYGLSFIKVHINENEKKTIPITQNKNVLPKQFLNNTTSIIGKLKYREDSPDSESENSSSLFNRWKKLRENDVETATAAAIRTASKTLDSRLQPINSEEIPDRNRANLLFGDENDNIDNANITKRERLSKKIEADKERRRLEKEKELNKNKRKSIDVTNSLEISKNMNDKIVVPSCSKNISINKTSSDVVRKRPSSPPENPKKKVKPTMNFRPFNQLLKGVVLVISGIQNPDRGDLRNKAIALGAKYKADWDSTCTHLICAFKNTPKYNQVRGKGKIVTRSWIEKCYSLKKYLPWRRYALDSTELSKPESDEEIFDDINNLQNAGVNIETSVEKSREGCENKNHTLALYDIDDQKQTNNSTLNNESFSESDTDDEIKRIEQEINIVDKNVMPKHVNIFEATTDEEDYITEKLIQKNK